MKTLRLVVRAPSGLVLDRPVRAVRAEDLDGWFGIAPGRAELVAALPPGLFVFRDDEGEGFVALASGLLWFESDVCRVLARDVVVSRDLSHILADVDERLARRGERASSQRGVMLELFKEALSRLAREARA